MATGTIVPFSKQALLVGDGATPTEVFAALCGITSLTKTTNKETGTVNMPDCENPDLPGWLEVYLISNQMVISGSGTIAQESLQTWDEWDRTGEFKNVRWLRDITAANGGGHYQGRALLTQWEEVAEARAPFTFNFAVTFSGQPVWTPTV